MDLTLIKKSLKKGISYSDYRNLIKKLLEKGKSTGKDQNENLLKFSQLNDRRMDRLDKTITVSNEIQGTLNEFEKVTTLLVIAEGWCGDAAQIVPAINKIAESSAKIDLKIVLRDENEVLMNQFLTNGGQAIPKVIILDEGHNVLNNWGPRPAVATKMVSDFKEKNGFIDETFKKDLQLWYNKDKGKSTQEDLLKILKITQN